MTVSRNLSAWMKAALIMYFSLLFYSFFYGLPKIFEDSLDILKDSHDKNKEYVLSFSILLLFVFFVYAGCNSNIPPHTYPN